MKKIIPLALTAIIAISSIQLFAQTIEEPEEPKERIIIPAQMLSFSDSVSKINSVSEQEIESAYLQLLYRDIIKEGYSIATEGKAKQVREAHVFITGLRSITIDDDVSERYKIWATETAVTICNIYGDACEKNPIPFELGAMMMESPESAKSPLWFYAEEKGLCGFFEMIIMRGEELDITTTKIAVDRLLSMKCDNEHLILRNAPEDWQKEVAAERILNNPGSLTSYDLVQLVIYSPKEPQKEKAWSLLLTQPCELYDCLEIFSEIRRKADEPYGSRAVSLLEKIDISHENLNSLDVSNLVQLMKK